MLKMQQVQYARRSEPRSSIRPQSIDLRKQVRDRVDDRRIEPVRKDFDQALRELPGKHVSYDKRVQLINEWVNKHQSLISDPKYHSEAIKKIQDQEKYLDRTARQEWSKLDFSTDPSLSYNERVEQINRQLEQNVGILGMGQNIQRLQDVMSKKQKELDRVKESEIQQEQAQYDLMLANYEKELAKYEKEQAAYEKAQKEYDQQIKDYERALRDSQREPRLDVHTLYLPGGKKMTSSNYNWLKEQAKTRGGYLAVKGNTEEQIAAGIKQYNEYIQRSNERVPEPKSPSSTSPSISVKDLIADLERKKLERMMSFSGLVLPKKPTPSDLSYQQKAQLTDVLSLSSMVSSVQDQAKKEGLISNLVITKDNFDWTPIRPEYTPQQKELIDVKLDTELGRRDVEKLSKELERTMSSREYKQLIDAYYSSEEKAKATKKMLKDYELQRPTLTETPKNILTYMSIYERVDPKTFDKIETLSTQLDKKIDSYTESSDRLSVFQQDQQELYDQMGRLSTITEDLSKSKKDIIETGMSPSEYRKWREDKIWDYQTTLSGTKQKDIWGIVGAPIKRDPWYVRTKDKISDFISTPAGKVATVASTPLVPGLAAMGLLSGLSKKPELKEPEKPSYEQYIPLSVKELRSLAPKDREMIMITEGPMALSRQKWKEGDYAGAILSPIVSVPVKGLMIVGEEMRKEGISDLAKWEGIKEKQKFGKLGDLYSDYRIEKYKIKEGFGELLSYNPDALVREGAIGFATWGVGSAVSLYGAKKAAQMALLTKGVSVVDKAKKTTDWARRIGAGMGALYVGGATMEVAAAPKETRSKKLGEKLGEIAIFAGGSLAGVGIGKASAKILGPMDTKFKMRAFEGGFKPLVPVKPQSPIKIKKVYGPTEWAGVSLMDTIKGKPTIRPGVKSYEVTFQMPGIKKVSPDRLPQYKIDEAYKEMSRVWTSPKQYRTPTTSVGKLRERAKELQKYDYDQLFALGQDIKSIPKRGITPKLQSWTEFKGVLETGKLKSLVAGDRVVGTKFETSLEGQLKGSYWQGDEIIFTKAKTGKGLLSTTKHELEFKLRYKPDIEYKLVQEAGSSILYKKSPRQIDPESVLSPFYARGKDASLSKLTTFPGQSKLSAPTQTGKDLWKPVKLTVDEQKVAGELFTKGFTTKPTPFTRDLTSSQQYELNKLKDSYYSSVFNKNEVKVKIQNIESKLKDLKGKDLITAKSELNRLKLKERNYLSEQAKLQKEIDSFKLKYQDVPEPLLQQAPIERAPAGKPKITEDIFNFESKGRVVVDLKDGGLVAFPEEVMKGRFIPYDSVKPGTSPVLQKEIYSGLRQTAQTRTSTTVVDILKQDQISLIYAKGKVTRTKISPLAKEVIRSKPVAILPSKDYMGVKKGITIFKDEIIGKVGVIPSARVKDTLLIDRIGGYKPFEGFSSVSDSIPFFTIKKKHVSVIKGYPYSSFGELSFPTAQKVLSPKIASKIKQPLLKGLKLEPVVSVNDVSLVQYGSLPSKTFPGVKLGSPLTSYKSVIKKTILEKPTYGDITYIDDSIIRGKSISEMQRRVPWFKKRFGDESDYKLVALYEKATLPPLTDVKTTFLKQDISFITKTPRYAIKKGILTESFPKYKESKFLEPKQLDFSWLKPAKKIPIVSEPETLKQFPKLDQPETAISGVKPSAIGSLPTKPVLQTGTQQTQQVLDLSGVQIVPQKSVRLDSFSKSVFTAPQPKTKTLPKMDIPLRQDISLGILMPKARPQFGKTIPKLKSAPISKLQFGQDLSVQPQIKSKSLFDTQYKTETKGIMGIMEAYKLDSKAVSDTKIDPRTLQESKLDPIFKTDVYPVQDVKPIQKPKLDQVQRTDFKKIFPFDPISSRPIKTPKPYDPNIPDPIKPPKPPKPIVPTPIFPPRLSLFDDGSSGAIQEFKGRKDYIKKEFKTLDLLGSKKSKLKFL
jgi:tetratricopeptide (TPR) repeat protein